MSDEAYARSTTREAKIWNPFSYSFPFNADQTADRTIIFGLYANAYLNGHKYLNEIESEELANLLTDYNTKIAGLTAQETIVVADIVSKRYLANIDKLIHDQKMTTKQAEIDNEDDIMDARIAALEADREGLETMAVKVATETTKTQARITELETYIELEGINLSLAEVEVVEKEITSARLDNDKLNMANAILEIQIQTVETAQELVDIDVKIARTKLDIANTERDIAKIGLMNDELAIEQAKTALEQAGIPISAARISLAQAKYDDAEAEKDYYTSTLPAQEAESLTNDLDLMSMEYIIKASELTRKEDVQDLANEQKRQESDLAKTLVTDDQETQELVDAQNIELIDARPINKWLEVLAAIEAEKKIAAANIITNLTHSISTGST
jgi:hypothetical protein